MQFLGFHQILPFGPSCCNNIVHTQTQPSPNLDAKDNNFKSFMSNYNVINSLINFKGFDHINITCISIVRNLISYMLYMYRDR